MAERSFAERVYALLNEVPLGSVTTYGDLARKLGTSPRAVGQALKRNPDAPRVPCHRVVKSNGRIGGYKGSRSGRPFREKELLLRKEGIRLIDGRIAEFDRVRYHW